MPPYRVLIVDDSALFRTILRNVLSEIPDCEVVGSVADGRAAIDKITELTPDLVTLDVEMPEFSGIEVLRELKRRRVHSQVVMVSRLTSSGAQVTTDALLEGAFDFILKPSGSSPTENKASLRTALEARIHALREARPVGEVSSESDSHTSVTTPRERVDAVIIGCSTGGPDALARVVPNLSARITVPIFIVQHMPEGYTTSLANRLNEASELEVLEAADGQRPRAGQVILARGGSHLEFQLRGTSGCIVKLSQAPHEHGCRPAVDVTLRSAVEIFQGRLLVVILTGMGRDGTAGCQLARSHGAQVIAQHAEGCVVYGMPKAVIQAGQADHIIRLPNIATTLERLAAPPST